MCHEVKIPLSSALLVSERIQDPQIRQSMREPLEKNQTFDEFCSGGLQSSEPDL